MYSFRRFLKRCFPQRHYHSELSETEINAVKDSWSRARHADIGRRILFSLIYNKPNFADYYGIGVSLPDHELLANELFNLQAQRIQQFLETVVASLGCISDSAIHCMAQKIGQIHYYRGVNFGADNWLVFKKVTIEQILLHQHRKYSSSFSTVYSVDSGMSVLDSINNNKICMTTIGWNRIMGIIIREMKRGFLQEAQRNCHERT